MNELARVLTEQGRKKQWLAQATGISVKTLTRYLSGETEPSNDWWRAAANVLGCDPEDLFGTSETLSGRASAETTNAS